MSTSPRDFYDRLAPFYHLIFPDWHHSVERQGRILDGVIAGCLGAGSRTVLDVSCGIGTQALGLAMRGHRVTASDVSPGAIERARREAAARGLAIDFSVADMARADAHHRRQFDVVLSGDNSLPHLLDDEAILGACRAFHDCTTPGGCCVITVRDYDSESREAIQVRPYGLRRDGDRTYLLLQTWEFDGERYSLTIYCIEHGSDNPQTHAVRTTYYAISIPRLSELMALAGYVDVRRVPSEYHQPVIVGRRPRLAP